MNGENHYLYGKHLPEGTKKKLSKSLKGRISPMKGKHHSEETKKKISEAFKGKHLSERHKIKIRKALFGKKKSDNHRKKLSEASRKAWEANKMPQCSEETKMKISKLHKGRKRSKETRLKISVAKKGCNNNFWKGGVTPEALRIRVSSEYKEWRKAVFERDNYTCQKCGKVGGKLNADHIKRFSDYPGLRFDINNGRTLCQDCHKTTDTFGRWGRMQEIKEENYAL